MLLHDEGEGWALAHTGAALLDLDELDEADFVLAQALVAVKETLRQERVGFVRSEQAYLALLDGEIELEITRRQQAVQAFDQSGDGEALWRAEQRLAESYVESGAFGLATAHYRRALAGLHALPLAGPGLEQDRDRQLHQIAVAIADIEREQ